MKYQAFISYRHSEHSREHAVALESAVKRYARPLYRWPPRVFRDETQIPAGQSLPEAISGAIENSEYLIYIASVEAAGSPWVTDEISQWVGEHARRRRTIVYWIADDVVFRGKEIDWGASNALPAELKPIGPSPLVVDARWAVTAEQMDLRNERFRKQVNSIVARLRGVRPEELEGEEIRVFRRNRRIWIGLGAAVTALAIVATVLGLIVRSQRDSARREATANSWATRAFQIAATDHTRGLNAMYRAYRHAPNAGIERSLFQWFGEREFYVRRYDHPGEGAGHACFSPKGDIVAVSHGDRVTLRRVDGPPLATIEPKNQAITGLAFDPEGERILIGCFGGLAAIWSIEGVRERTLGGARAGGGRGPAMATGTLGRVDGLCWSSSGRHVLVWRDSGLVRIHDLEAGESRALFTDRRFVDAAFALDGRSIFVAAEETDSVWQIDLEGEEQRRWDEFGATLRCLAVTQGHLVTGHAEGNVVVHDLESPGVTSRQIWSDAAILSVAMSEDGRFLAGGDEKGRVVLWGTDGAPPILNEDHAGRVTAVDFSPNGDLWMTASVDEERVRIWSTAPRQRPEVRFQAERYELRCLALAPDDGRILTGGHDDSPRIWSPAGNLQLELEQHESGVTAAVFGPRGDRLVTTSSDGVAYLFSRDGDLIVKTEKTNGMNSVAQDLEGGWFVTSGLFDGAIEWNTEGEEVRRFELGDVRIESIAIHPETDTVAFGTGEGELVLVERAGSIQHRIMAHSGPIYDVAFSVDGASVLTGSWDRTAKLWSTEGGSLVRSFEGGHESYVHGIAFQPGTGRVATAGLDGVAHIWSKEGYPIRTVRHWREDFVRLAFSPDGQRLVTGLREGEVEIWDADPRIDDYMSSGRVSRFSDSELGLGSEAR